MLVIRRMSTLAQLPKTSSYTKRIAADAQIATEAVAAANTNNIIRKPRILHGGGFSWLLPEERKAYKYVTSSEPALRDVGLLLSEPQLSQYQDIVSGKFYLDNEDFRNQGFPFPYSQCYAGWQFGQFAGQLGDGRVHNLFEIDKPGSARGLPSWINNRRKYEVQLKGSGKTPFSRFADGKAVVRSSIREYIISEHLNAIGIPTTRALALTYLPKTFAQRHAAEKCAVVARFAESWIRLGSFDLYRWRFDQNGLRELADYVIDELFTVEGKRFPVFSALVDQDPAFYRAATDGLGALTDYDRMYFETIIRNAETAALWQCYGFMNGVLNTDNTSILGLSMDYGPFSIMDRYDPEFTPNSEDHQKRYSYGNSPSAIWWNLTRLGENMAQLIGAGPALVHNEMFKQGHFEKGWEDEVVARASKIIEVGGEVFMNTFTKRYVEAFFDRLGLSRTLIDGEDPEKQNAHLLAPMLEMLRKVKCDFNKFFVILQDAKVESASFDADSFAGSILLKDDNAFELYDRDEYRGLIKKWLVTYQDYVKKTNDLGEFNRLEHSRKHNPVFLPRSWILDEVIEQCQESQMEDISYLKKLEKMAFYPFDLAKWGDDLKDLEEKWLLQSDRGADFAFWQCSCSS